jgi:Transposase, Mutator family
MGRRRLRAATTGTSLIRRSAIESRQVTSREVVYGNAAEGACRSPIEIESGHRVILRRKRAERAHTSVVATCYLLGLCTRRMERPVESFGVTRLSKSQVSAMAAELDEQVEAFRTRRSTPASTHSWPPTLWCSKSTVVDRDVGNLPFPG